MNTPGKISEGIQTPRKSLNLSYLFLAVALLLATSLAACGGGSGGGGGATGTTISGTVTGGGGISGETVTLYAAVPGASSPQPLGSGTTTGSNGSFSISYTPPPSNAFLYLSTSPPTTSPYAAFLGILGESGTKELPSSINLNELSTVVGIDFALRNRLGVTNSGSISIPSSVTTSEIGSLVSTYLQNFQVTKGQFASSVSSSFGNPTTDTDIANNLATCVNNGSSPCSVLASGQTAMSGAYIGAEDIYNPSNVPPSETSEASGLQSPTSGGEFPTPTVTSTSGTSGSGTGTSGSGTGTSGSGTGTSGSGTGTSGSGTGTSGSGTGTSGSGTGTSGSGTGTSGSGTGTSGSGTGTSGSGTGSVTSCPSTSSDSTPGALILESLDSSNNLYLTTYAFNHTNGCLLSSSNTSQLEFTVSSVSGESYPTNYNGGGYDPTEQVYVIFIQNGSSGTIKLYHFTPATGFGSLIGTQTVTGTNCGGPALDTNSHFIVVGCTSSSGSGTSISCGFFYTSSSLGGCVSPSSTISAGTNNFLGADLMNSSNEIFWEYTPATSSTVASISEILTLTVGSGSFSGSVSSISPAVSVPDTTPSESPSALGLDDLSDLLLVTINYNCSSSCTTQPTLPLTVYSYTSSGNLTQLGSPQNMPQGYPINGPLSGNHSGSNDSVDKIFMISNYSSTNQIIPVSYASFTSEGNNTLTTLTPLTNPVTSPSGNSNTVIDTNDHLLFLPVGSGSSITAIAAIPYLSTGFSGTINQSTVTIPNGATTVGSCTSSSNCTYMGALFDVVN